MIAITAVIFVPLLYAGMFLWAFWDPYDHLDDIPVAIVNEDVPYEYEDELLELGNELVDKLKEEDEFDFHFVERQVGYKGLKDEDYYILIEIPNDFSRNATTLMDDHPEKLRLRYVPNESYNFLASQIGETAMLQIEMALEENIIETYTETMFDQVDEIVDGLYDAKEATEELDDGADELAKNTHTLKDHLKTLAESSVEFIDGTTELKNGVTELVDGSNELAFGVNQLQDASSQLLDGAKQVGSGQNELAEGLRSAKNGTNEIKRNMPTLIDGTEQFVNGLQQFEKELPNQIASEINHAVEEGSATLMDGLTKLEQGILSGLGAENNNPDGLAAQLSHGLNEEISKELNKVAQNMGQIPEQITESLSTSLAKHLYEQNQAQVSELAAILAQLDLPAEQTEEILKDLTKDAPTEAQLQQQLATAIGQGLNEQMPDIEQALADKQAKLETSIYDGVFYAVGETEKQIIKGLEQFSEETEKNLSQTTENVESMIAGGTKPAFDLLQEGIKEIDTGQKSLQAGVNELFAGTDELTKGAETLQTGQTDYISQMTLFTSKFGDATSGAQELASGSFKLLDGANQLDDGAGQLSDGANELSEGSEKLADGMDTLKEGTAEFDDEIADAVTEINDVETDEETYNMMANPVEVDNEKVNEVPNYGTGFAPYFLSLGLYVGALLLSIVYPLREPSIIPTSGFNWFLRKTAGLGIIGILQALIAASLLLFGLGIEVQSVPLFYMYAIFTSWTFIAVVQFLVTCFDDPGRFMAIIVLILQLTTSAGTFPLELIPKVLQPFNALLPMTYTVDGFKAVISSGNFNVMWINSGILAIFTVISLLLTLSYFIVMFKRKFATMQSENS